MLSPRVIIVVIKVRERNYNCMDIRLSTLEPRWNEYIYIYIYIYIYRKRSFR